MRYFQLSTIPTTAAFATFSLFYLMQSLVSVEEINLFPDKPILYFTGVIEIETDPLKARKIDRHIDPPEKVKPPELIEEILPQGKQDIDTRIEIIHPIKPTKVNARFNPGMMDGERTPIVRVQPSYPAVALRRGLSGWVILEFDVNPYGSVINATVIDAEPQNIFNRSALKALQRFKYKPTVVDGQPRASKGVQFRMVYNIADD